MRRRLQVLGVCLLLSVAGFTTAGTDYTCVTDCTGRGYMYSYCKSRCSYDEPAERRRLERKVETIDYACLSDCTRSGYTYQYCRRECSY